VGKNFAVLDIFFMGIPPRHLSQIKTRAIPLIWQKVGKNFAVLDIFHEKYIKDGKVLAHF
jgi:hypothetical protein